MKRHLFGSLLAMTALVASAHAYQPYATDLMQEEAVKPAARTCPPLNAEDYAGKQTLSQAAANALLCRAVEELPLAESVWEYGCTDRSEVIIGSLLNWGVDAAALGRASTFYDATRNTGGHEVFVLEDAAHGNDFYRAWQLVFGNTFRREILLKYNGQEYLLDVDGTIKWNIGHIAPTLWVETGEGRELRVLDPLLGPDALLTLEEWRARQNAEAAAVLWGALGYAPDILVEYLSGGKRERFLRAFNMTSFGGIDTEQMNALLRDTPPEMKAQLYADILDIDPKASWHPLRWSGYSFAGDSLPDWNPKDAALVQRRYAAALERLAPLRAYHELRERYADDEAFLNAVKERMLLTDKQPKRVFIDFSEPY